MPKKKTVYMTRKYREVPKVSLTNRYGIVLSEEQTYQSDALEDLMGFLLSWERYQDPNPTPAKAMKRWAKMAKQGHGVDVDTSSYRHFFETVPDEMLAFYENTSYPISPNSKME